MLLLSSSTLQEICVPFYSKIGINSTDFIPKFFPTQQGSLLELEIHKMMLNFGVSGNDPTTQQTHVVFTLYFCFGCCRHCYFIRR